MDQCVHRFLIGCAAALLLCGGHAAAQVYSLPPSYSPPPSANEAHDFLTDTFQRYAIDYVLWYGDRMGDHYRGRVDRYRGQDCRSEVGTDRSGSAFAVDWSTISAVQASGPNGVYVIGQLARQAQYTGFRTYANFHIYAPDARVSKSVLNAFEAIRSSCVKRSRFD